MTTNNLLYIFLILSLLISCDKDGTDIDDNNEIESEVHDYIIAGKYDYEFDSFVDLQPDIIVPETVIGCQTYSGRDTFCFFNSTSKDLELYYYLYNDISGNCCSNCYGGLLLEQSIFILKSNIKIHTNSKNWAIPLEYGDTISSEMNWSDHYRIILSYSDNPASSGNGYWVYGSIKDNKYLGVRIIESADTLYGYLLINAGNTIELKEYAINK